MVMVPTPGPVPTPLPHPFVGYVWDPVGAAIAAGMGDVSGKGMVRVNGLPAASTGTAVKALAHHLPTPPGLTFAPNDIPGNEGSIVTGSKTVSFGGSSAARSGSMVTTCNFPVNLPTSVLHGRAHGRARHRRRAGRDGLDGRGHAGHPHQVVLGQAVQRCSSRASS